MSRTEAYDEIRSRDNSEFDFSEFTEMEVDSVDSEYAAPGLTEEERWAI